MLGDLKLAWRTLWTAKAFTAAVALSLALGIGAGTAIFSLIDAVLFRPLPFPDPERLVGLQRAQSWMDIEDLRRELKGWAGAGIYSSSTFDSTGEAEPERIEGSIVSGGLLPALAVRPLLGRVITPDDDRKGAPPVAMVSHQYWTRRLSADPRAIGRSLTLDGRQTTLVGVLPPEFELGLTSIDLLAPFSVFFSEAANERGARFTIGVARLAPGVSREQAQAELAAAGQRLAEAHPATNRDRVWAMEPLHERTVGSARPTLLLLLGAVGLSVLVACANFANLLLAQGFGRQRNLGIRAALGATRLRLIRQQLVESLLLALLGGALGVLLAAWLMPVLIALAPPDLPRLSNVTLDLRILGVALLASVVTGILFGLPPALQLSRIDLHSMLGGGGRSTASGGHARLRRLLVMAELSVSLALLISAGLLLRSFAGLQRAPLGFEPGSAVTVRVGLPELRYKKAAESVKFFAELTRALEQEPSIAKVGLVSEPPLAGNSVNHDVTFEGRPAAPAGQEPSARVTLATAGHFEALRIPIRRGRNFARSDGPGAPPVTLINESFARTHFAGQDPLGQRIAFARFDDKPRWMEIVGVVADVSHDRPGAPDGPAVYVPVTQNLSDWRRWETVIAEPRPGASAAAAAAIKKAALALDPLLPIAAPTSMSAVAGKALGQARFTLTLVGLFAGLALAMTAVGIYGVVSFAVSQRTRELGLRMALGASGPQVVGLVLRESLSLLSWALPAGIAGAAAASQLMKARLFGIGPADPITYGVTLALVAAVALLASWAPARRASRIDPMAALRSE